MKKKKIVFYSDPINDDFGTAHEHPKDTYKHFKFYRKGLDRFWCDLFTFAFAMPIIKLIGFIHGYRIKGLINLKRARWVKSGVFVYSNHVGIFDVAFAVTIGMPKRVNFVGYDDALTIPVAKHLVRPLGFIPTPRNPLDLLKFQEVLKFYSATHKEAIVIYPEAHLWPEYTGVRDFKRTSFRYPAKFNQPVLPIYFARRKKRGLYRLKRKNPVTMYVGELIYPKEELNEKENAKYLGDSCYNFMKHICDTIPQDSTYEYVYIDKRFNPNYKKEGNDL